MRYLKIFAPENKFTELFSTTPFVIYIIADFACNEGTLAPSWTFWPILIYACMIVSYFRKQLRLLGGLTIMWTVLGIIVLIVANALMNWDITFSLIPIMFVIIQIEMCLFLPYKRYSGHPK